MMTFRNNLIQTLAVVVVATGYTNRIKYQTDCLKPITGGGRDKKKRRKERPTKIKNLRWQCVAYYYFSSFRFFHEPAKNAVNLFFVFYSTLKSHKKKKKKINKGEKRSRILPMVENSFTFCR